MSRRREPLGLLSAEELRVHRELEFLRASYRSPRMSAATLGRQRKRGKKRWRKLREVR